MLFNSVGFAIYLPIVFGIYWLYGKKNVAKQNIFLLFASYYFYGLWDWRFLLLLIFNTLIGFFVGLSLINEHDDRRRRAYLFLGAILILGVLGVFKYFNFFIEGFISISSIFNLQLGTNLLNIVLPIGLSFYAFQTLGYIIQVYLGQVSPTKDILTFSAFIGFFPLLLAGPIERGTTLLPQFSSARTFNSQQSVDGMRQILWGLFKKIVIADNLVQIVNQIFTAYPELSGSTLVIGALLFSFQIYCDFSGYSDISIGVAKLFGFNLIKNFGFPYFATNIADFWRRWHISLSSWLMDFVFTPLQLSFRYLGIFGNILAILITFVLCGIWHGANWTFIVWGALNGLYFLPILLFRKKRGIKSKRGISNKLGGVIQVSKILVTFSIVMFTWVFFRSETVSDAFIYISRIFTNSLFTLPDTFGGNTILLVSLAMFTVEWFQKDKQHALDFSGRNIPRFVRWGYYYTIVFSLFWFGSGQQEFIYLQF